MNKKINFDQLSDHEKFMLKSKLKNSIQTYISKKRSNKYSWAVAAASVVLLISVALYSYFDKAYSPIEKFAKNVETKKANSEVALIINGAKSIEVKESDSVISYSNLGKKITIGNTKTIEQKVEDKQNIAFNTLLVPYGKRKEIVLSDGTKVWLNSGSKLIFPAYFNSKEREVYLEGEAIFEVAHNANKPFFVKSNNHTIQVLGTVFNVSNYTDDEAIKTVLKSGSIEINYKNSSFFNASKSVKISPNTLATYHKNDKNIKMENVDTEKYFSWREGIFIFKNDSMASIMKSLSRYYDLEIIINNENLSEHTFSGYLDVNEDINHVMKTIIAAENSSFTYKITTDKQLIIN